MKNINVPFVIFLLIAIAGILIFFFYDRKITSDEVLGDEQQLYISFNPNKEKFAPVAGSVTISKDSEPFQRLAAWIDSYSGKWYQLEYDVVKPLMDMTGEHARIQITDHNIYLLFNNKNGHPRAFEGHSHFEEFGFLWELKE